MQDEHLTGINHNLDNQTYRDAPGLSATFLKGCIRSVKHALTPRKPTTSTDRGLRLHEFILERDKFLSSYAPGLDISQHPDAIGTMDELRAAIDELNANRKPVLKKTGSKEQLTESLYADDQTHFDGVQDVSALSAADLKKRIEFVNSSPDRGLISTTGSALQLTERLLTYGYEGPPIIHQLIAEHNRQHKGRAILPIDEYRRYDAMYSSLIEHLEIGAEDGQPLFKWLLYAFTTPGVLETEVSVFATQADGTRAKCRLDARFKAGDKRIGIELKSTADAQDEAFTRQCARLHYDLAHEHYISVCADAGEPLDLMVFIAIEIEPFHGVNIMTADEQFRLTGKQKLAYAKRLYREYSARKRNTAYSPTVKTVTSPLWNACGPWENEDVD